MSAFDEAVRVWIVRRIDQYAPAGADHDPAKITNVVFENIQHGYCETCWSSSIGIQFDYDGKTSDVDIEGVIPGVFVAEVAQIALELGLVTT